MLLYYLSTYFIYLFIYIYIYLFAYLFIYLFMYLFISSPWPGAWILPSQNILIMRFFEIK